MSHFIKPNRVQLRFQSLDIEKLVPQDHPVRFFWKVCEDLDLKALYDDYKITENSEGRPANDPRVLLCLWVYAYSEGINSCRQVAEACKTRADLIWLCGDITPEYRSLAHFRASHTQALEDAFCQMVVVLDQAGLIKSKVFFQDGTKIMADVSHQSFMKKDKLEQKLEEARLAYQQFTADAENSAVTGTQTGKKRAQRLKRRLHTIESAVRHVARIAERRKSLKKKDREQCRPQDAKASVTDPSCQYMLVDKNTKRIEPAYTAQICIEGDSQIIIGKEVSNEPTDVNRLIPVIEVVKSNLAVSEIKGAYVTDGGYYKDKNITEAETIGVKRLILPINTGSKSPATEAVKRRANSEKGKELLRRRSSTIERIISFIKERLRLRRFKLRGLVKAGCEWTFICLAYNMTRYMQLAT